MRRIAMTLACAAVASWGCRSAPPEPPVPTGEAPAGPETRPDTTRQAAALPTVTTVRAVPAPGDTLAAVVPPPVGAPPAATRSQRCQFVIENVDREGARIEVSPGVVNYFAGGNVRFRCANVPVRIASDSVASYQGSVVQFVGRVRYRDSTVETTADFGTYFRDAEKWEARGNVQLRNLRDGSTLRGPMLDYFRAAAGLRDSSEMYADQRPTISLPVRDSTGAEGVPYVIVGDRVRMRGNDRMWSGGRVTIDRTDLRGRGDSLELDTGPAGEGALIGTAVVRRIAMDSFELAGARIDLRLERRQLTYVTARDSASLTGTDLQLTGDAIGLDIDQGEVWQTVAWGRAVRPVALSTDYEVRGDSVAFDTPRRELKEIRAFGTAWLGAKPDSAGDRDWVAGDSVTASFVTRDSAGVKRPALQRLEARRNGRALYRFWQGGQAKPSISYTKADLIVVTMLVTADSVKVDSVFARGNVDGVHLQPGFRPDSLRADSLRTRADTAGATPPRRRR